jgi:hypothetical protein
MPRTNKSITMRMESQFCDIMLLPNVARLVAAACTV